MISIVIPIYNNHDMTAECITAVRENTQDYELILVDNGYWSLYMQSLQAIQRLTSENKGVAGFESLKFMGADVVADGGMNGSAPSAHMWMLNTDYISWRPHRKRNFVPLNPDRYSTNQDAMIKLIAVAGNMTVKNRSLQGVMVA